MKSGSREQTLMHVREKQNDLSRGLLRSIQQMEKETSPVRPVQEIKKGKKRVSIKYDNTLKEIRKRRHSHLMRWLELTV